ncbi:hypothetical protein Gorai_004545, partial [Gossypium raimondii]|nr:hypothetical protein [Gossypium raimondii]
LNQNTQQVLDLPKKKVIQPHLPVRLPCYNFTLVTNPTFGIPLIAIKHMYRPWHKGHDDLTSSSHSSSLSPTELTQHLTTRADNSYTPHVFVFAKTPLSFKRIRDMSNLGGILNMFATALHRPIRTMPSINHFLLGLLSGLKKPPIDTLRPIISNNAYILCIIAAVGTELPDAYSSNTIISTSLGKVHDPWAFYLYGALLVKLSPIVENSLLLPPIRVWVCLSPSVADHPFRPTTNHRLGKLLHHQIANQTRAHPRANSSFCSSVYRVLA